MLVESLSVMIHVIGMLLAMVIQIMLVTWINDDQ